MLRCFSDFCPACWNTSNPYSACFNVVHKINHARRNFTFTGKITPRVNLLKGYLREIEKAEIPDMKIMHAF